MSFVGKKYKLDKSENFDEYMKELGVEFDEETLDGRNVKSIITLDGNKLTQEQKGDKPTTIVREFTDNELITTLTIGSVKCVRVYKAV
ncbi:uncharacterized protein Dsimw501_GD20655, isoform C [Drosophila simulans]|nr:uncharacterized protein Dsimw501_GD20655, isoform C [Drosophila simulans]